MSISRQQVLEAPAGPEHMRLLDEYLRQPRSHWQPGQQPHNLAAHKAPALIHPSRAGQHIGARLSAKGRRPMRMRMRIALSAPVVARQRRQATMAAARIREAARRQERDRALAALDGFLTAGQRQQAISADGTLAGLLEARYALLRQARREAAALMAVPANGRALDPGYETGTTVNGSSSRAADRWQGTSRKRLAAIHPAAPWQCRAIRTLPLGKGNPLGSALIAGSYPAGREAAAAADRGASWQPFTPRDGGQGKGKGKRTRQAAPLLTKAVRLRRGL